uniref:Uncharacterized protein n=1 Tax=Chrysotila carterae TaxID=13221 RepID=A0A7S4BMW5_CHRCT
MTSSRQFATKSARGTSVKSCTRAATGASPAADRRSTPLGAGAAAASSASASPTRSPCVTDVRIATTRIPAPCAERMPVIVSSNARHACKKEPRSTKKRDGARGAGRQDRCQRQYGK